MSKFCCFLNFVDEACARAFFDSAQSTPFKLHGRDVKVNWAKATDIPAQIKDAIVNNRVSESCLAPAPNTILFCTSTCPYLTPSCPRLCFPKASRILCVQNLSASNSEDNVAAHFARFGDMENIVLHRAKAMGFVCFTSIQSALTAK
jgi:hypothetical protein